MIGSRRCDELCRDVHVASVKLGVLADSPESYLPALRYLVFEGGEETDDDKEWNLYFSLYCLHLICILDDLDIYSAIGEFAYRVDIRTFFPVHVVRAIVQGNYVRWWHLKKTANVYEYKLMEGRYNSWMCKRAVAVASRVYYTLNKEWLQANHIDETLHSWEIQSDGVVVVRRRN